MFNLSLSLLAGVASLPPCPRPAVLHSLGLYLSATGQHRILEGFRPDGAMLEASAQELVDERQEAFETLRERESGLRTQP